MKYKLLGGAMDRLKVGLFPLLVILSLMTLDLRHDAFANDPRLVDVDLAHGRAVPAFGVQVWPGAISPAALRVLDDLQVSAVRASLQPPPADSDLPRRQMSVEDILSLIDASDQAVATRIAKSFADLLATRHLSFHDVFWGFAWLKQPDGQTHLPDMAFSSTYANLIVARLIWLKRFGIVPDFIEITNEPHGGWNTLFTPEQYGLLVAAVHDAMMSHGLDRTGIEGPGTNPESLDRYLLPLTDNGHIDMLAAISVHVYDRSPDLSRIEIALDPKRDAAWDKPVFATEFNNASPVWTNPPFPSKPGLNVGLQAHASADFAVSVVADAVSLMADAVSTIFYWQLSDLRWTNGFFGLLSVDEKRKPVSRAMTMLPLPMRGGRLDNAYNRSGLPIACVTAATRSSCTIVNISKQPVVIALTLHGMNGSRCAAHVTLFDGMNVEQDVGTTTEPDLLRKASPNGTCLLEPSLKARTVMRIDLL